MSAIRKSREEAKSLGADLRKLRGIRGLSLEQVAERTGVNVGQLSRFECGQFVLIGKNLQKFRSFLQNQNEADAEASALAARFVAVLEKSDRHSAAAVAILGALELLE